MRDPLDELESFTTPGLTMDPLPASEVRRRGTRMRRRNHALATVGGLAAVALVAMPLSLAANGHDRSGPGPAETSSPSPTVHQVDWLLEIPADFPLDEGLGVGSTPAPGPGSGPAVADLTFCGVPAWSPASDDPVRAVDVTGVAYRGESEDTRSRRLALYTDDTAAQAALDAIRSTVDACPRDPNGSGAPLVQDVVATGLVADDSVVFTQQSAMGGGLLADLTVFQVARVGNALYVATQHTSAGGQQVVDSEVQRMAGLSAPVISDMCVFAADPC